ncbi:hypothetical protein L6Q96_17980 [Candidatus Binatia bacterium]|nr:hypothetical protein [Candidatus Binatia bacterium]
MKIRRPRGWLAPVLALALFAVGVVAVGRMVRPEQHRVTLMAGDPATQRALFGHMLKATLGKRGIDIRIVKPTPVEVALGELDAGTIDLALAPSALSFDGFPNLREVTPLYFEALQLVVRPELALAATEDLGALRGHTVDIGPAESGAAKLAHAVLRFAQVADGPDGVVIHHLQPVEAKALVEGGDRAALPDAFFVLSLVPSPPVLRLVRDVGYRLVPLAFADAFRLQGILLGGDDAGTHAVERSDVYETYVPPFVYETTPPVPAEELPTLGTRLLLLTNDRVPAPTVTAILEAIFTSAFARLSHPPLDDSVLAHPTRLTLHPGTEAYLARNRPFVTDERVDVLSNTVSIIGALGGSALFLWQWRRRLAQRARDELFGTYLRRLADVSRRVADVELAADLELEPLAAAQRQLLELKAEVLDGVVAGTLSETEALPALVMPINAAVEHVAGLILHVRENVEEKAQEQGRSVEALWAEALEGGEGTKTPPPAG